MNEPSKTGDGQHAAGGPTCEEVMADMRTTIEGLTRLQKQEKLFRQAWPKNVLLLVRAHIYLLFRLIEKRDELDVERFRTVLEASRVFLSFLQEESQYVEASAGGFGGSSSLSDDARRA